MVNHRSLEDSRLTFQNTARAQFVVLPTVYLLVLTSKCPELDFGSESRNFLLKMLGMQWILFHKSFRLYYNFVTKTLQTKTLQTL